MRSAAVARAPIWMEVRLFANLCEVTPGVIEVLHACDYRSLGDVYADFLDSGG